MHALLALVGTILLLAALVDIVWTTVGTHGGGPLSKRLTAGLWRLALGMHRLWPNHRLLSFAGSTIVVITAVFWVVLVWAGWFVIFSSNPNSLIDPHTKTPPGFSGRAYFLGYAISTMGNGDYQPNGAQWQWLTAICTLSGIGSVTLAVTYILSVLSAVVQKRSLGAYVSDLGGTPRKIIDRAWNGERFDALEQHLVSLTGMLHLTAEQHLAYPVLHYFHGENERSSATLRIASLHELIMMIAVGVPEEKRLSRMVTEPLCDAVGAFTAMMGDEFVDPAETAPPPPDLSILREYGVPTVSESEFRESVARYDEVRRYLRTLIDEDGWKWDDVMQKEGGGKDRERVASSE